MQTIPRIGLSKLSSLRGKERLFHVAWGLARWLTVALVVVGICTFIDWRMDKAREMPIWLRSGLSVVEAIVLGVTGWFWLLKPWAKGPSIIRLARRVEDGHSGVWPSLGDLDSVVATASAVARHVAGAD